MADLALIAFAAAMLVATAVNIRNIIARERKLRELRRAVESASAPTGARKDNP